MAIGLKTGESATANLDTDSSSNKTVLDDLKGSEATPRISKNKNAILTAVIIFIILMIIICLLKSVKQKQQTPPVSIDTGGVTTEFTSTTELVDTSTEVVGNPTTDISVGLPEFDPRENGSTSAIVYSATDYIKDLYGADIPAVYNVANRTYIRDFVNYEKKRAIIDEGMELYWLEVQYKGKAYRCQVPYLIFKDLDTTGICVVELEMLTLEGGETVISFMQVVRDYNDLIN